MQSVDVKKPTKSKLKFKQKQKDKSIPKINKDKYGCRDLQLMLLPGAVLVFIFSYLPLAGLVMAFQEFKPFSGFTGSEFVGFEQFKYIFSMPSFWTAFRNTFIIAFFKIMLSIIVPLILALSLNELIDGKFKKFVQTSIFLPYFLSWAVLGGIVLQFFAYDGIVNEMFTMLGNEKINFLVSNEWFRTIVISTDVWKGMGYNTILFLAALTGIDPTLYEAAKMDGANKIKQLIHITLPCIKGMVILLTILGLGGILNAGFEQIFILYNPIVEQTVDILDTFVYRLGIVSTQYSAAAAAGLFKSIVSMVFVGSSYWIAYKTTDYRVF